jgi:hypothetical protein
MAADGGLWKLEDVDQLRHAQLMSLQKAEQAEARRLREARHPSEQGLVFLGSTNHHSIRLKG